MMYIIINKWSGNGGRYYARYNWNKLQVLLLRAREAYLVSKSNQRYHNPIQRGCSFGIWARNRKGLRKKAEPVQTQMLAPTWQGKLWDVTKDILSDCQQYLNDLDHLICPKFCCSILNTTDAGPGVGVTNIEVHFRDVEIARIQSSERVQ